MLSSNTKIIWREKVGGHEFGAYNASSPSGPITGIYSGSCAPARRVYLSLVHDLDTSNRIPSMLSVDVPDLDKITARFSRDRSKRVKHQKNGD